MVEHARDLVVLLDEEGTPIYLNPSIERLTGISADELRNSDPLGQLHPDDVADIAEGLSLLSTNEAELGPSLVRICHVDGTWRWLEVLAANHLDDPEVAAVVVVGRDVTDRVLAEHEAAAERERYAKLVEHLPDPIVTFGPDGSLRFANRAAGAAFTGVIDELEAGHDHQLLDRWMATTAALVQQVAADGATRTSELEVQLRGELRCFEVTAVADKDPEGAIVGITTVSHDITERRRSEERLQLEVLRDPLTGLANRTGFELALGRSLEQWPPDALVAVLYLDVDDFKLINDTLGHAAGDDHLRTIARELEAAVRPGDVVGRLGGDEFGILPADVTSADDVARLADRVHLHLSAVAPALGESPTGTTSIGIAIAEPGARSPVAELLARADAAMYEAKRQGKGTTAVAS